MRTCTFRLGLSKKSFAVLLCILALGNAKDKQRSITVRNPTADDVEIRWDDGSAHGKLVTSVARSREVGLQTLDGHGFKLTRSTAKGGLEQVGYITVRPEEDVYTVPGPHVAEPASSWSVEAVQEAMLKLREETGAVDFLHRTPQRASLPMRCIIKNFRRYTVERHWDGNGRHVFQGLVDPMASEDGVTTYHGHVFLMKKDSDVVARFVMDYDRRVYVIDPDPEDVETIQSDRYQRHLEEMEFRDKYLADNGIPWLGAYPPVVPGLPMHPAPSSGIGTVAHTVNVRPSSRPEGFANDMTLDLIALSAGPPQGPRAFIIKDLMTEEECDHVVSNSKSLLKRSTVGQDKRSQFQDTRTSDQVFLPKSKTPTIELIHKRFADVLNITDGELQVSAEDLQVVRYKKGQQYAPHYDYSSSNERMATLLIYLERPSEEGGTSFPRAFGDRGLKFRPQKGSALLFYSRLDDGNLDEMSLHAGLPVQDGEKMVCNLWLRARPRGIFGKNRQEI